MSKYNNYSDIFYVILVLILIIPKLFWNNEILEY